MCVDTLRDVLHRVAEDALCRELIRAFTVEPCRASVAAFVWCMMTSRRIHDATEARQELMIRERPAVLVGDERDTIAAHPVFVVRQHFLADRHDAVAPGGGLTLTDAVDSLLELDVGFEHMQKFRRSRPAVAHHDDSHRHRRKRVIYIVSDGPHSVKLARIEGLFLVLASRHVDINESADISSRRDELILDCVTIDVVHDLPHLLLHRVSDAGCRHRLNDALQLGHGQISQSLVVYRGALSECDVIILGSNIRDALAPFGHLESVGVCERDVRSEDCRALIELDKVSQGIVEISKVGKILLPPVDCAADCVGPAAAPRKLCNTAVSIRHFHLNHLKRKDTT